MKKTSRQVIENHDIRQRRYPMPGTDLGATNAIPFNQAENVDAGSEPFSCDQEDTCSCGHQGMHWSFEQHEGHLGKKDFAVRKPIQRPSNFNPTRSR